MKNLILRSLALVCCIWAVNSYAKIIINSPPDVPTNLNAHEFKELTAKRNDLLTQFGEVQAKIDSQARDCHDVEENSPKVEECTTKANEVKYAVRSYRAALTRFNDSLAASVAWQQSESNKGSKLSMSTKHKAHPIVIESDGEFYAVMANGRKLSGPDASQLTEDDEAKLVTGPNGSALMTLENGTQIKLGSNTEYLTKVEDSNPGSSEQPSTKHDFNADEVKPSVSELVKGTLRWVHEESSELKIMLNESPGETRSRHILEGKIKVSHVLVGVRGTDFECNASPDGSGQIKLFSGEITVSSKLIGAELTLMHGQMITFTKDKVGAVMQIPGGV